MTELISSVLNWIYPQPCPVCNEIVADNYGICEKCHTHNLNRINNNDGDICLKCGRPNEHSGMICDNCTGQRFYFERSFPVFAYEHLLRKAIHRFKYSFNPYSAAVFGKEIGNSLLKSEHARFFVNHKNDFAVISVPLYKDRFKIRGYNQSEILAREVAKILGMPFIKDFVIRTKNTAPQSEIVQLDRRAENVKDAFAVRAPERIKSKYILIVDDIYTTGTTLNELSRTIREMTGKQSFQIFTVTLAITSGPKMDLDLDL